MLDEPIEETYFNWLYLKVASVENPTPSLTYWTLFRDLHAVEFHWMVSGDDNRAADGLDLRKDFLKESYLPHDQAWLSLGCSVLEMLIAFAYVVAFETNESPREWFWVFLENLHLAELNDAMNGISRKVSTVLDRLIWRRYRRDGKGGMFPIAGVKHDQREIELWYQFCEYLAYKERL
mgnify:CR=1 FL=1